MSTEQAKPSLREAVQNLPHLLRQAAEILELKASERGGISVLSPKLSWYAERIEDALEETTEPEKREEIEKTLLSEATERTMLGGVFYNKWDLEKLVNRLVGDSSKGGDLEVSDRSPDESPVVSHTCTDSNSNQQ